jgi:hypothetical protein
MGRLEADEYGDPDDDPSVMRLTHGAPAICLRIDSPMRWLWPVGMPMGQLVTAAVHSKAGLAVLPTPFCSSARHGGYRVGRSIHASRQKLHGR